MRLQNLGFLGYGYAPWGVGTPAVTNPAAGVAAAGGGAGESSGLRTGASPVGADVSALGAGVSGLGGNGSAFAGGTSSSGGSAPAGISSPNDNNALTGALSRSSIGSALSSALSISRTGGAAELAVVRESETLKIQLADGSQVTIRVRVQAAAFGAAQTQADGSFSSAAAIFTSGQLQVAVNGNLSSADMQAISDVVSQVNSLATQFFAGDVQDAFAAAASLNIDPSEIAGFSMKLSYSSTLIQQASAPAGTPVTSPSSSSASSATSNGSTPGAATWPNTTSSAAGASGASASGATSGPAAAGTSPADTISRTSTVGTSASGTSAANPAGSAAPTAGAATSTPASGTPDSSATSTSQSANAASPQQVIINFIQTVMTKLGRGAADSPSHLRASSRWKLHLLAEALPAYAQAQATGASAASTTATTTSTAPATTAQNVQPTAAQAATVAAATLQVPSNRYPTLQAARLAADTLSQLAQ